MADCPEHLEVQARKKAPITANPAFPFVVAIWFAALLGVGSLIVPTALVESVIVASGLPSFIPQMAPPLGFTAKALIALTGAVGGGVIGYILARKIAGSRVKAEAERPARAPLSAYDELDEAGIADDETEWSDDHDDLPAPVLTGRRRALAIEEEERPSDFLTMAPLPGTVSEEATYTYSADDSALELEPSAELLELDEPSEDAVVEAEVAEEEVVDRQEFLVVAEAETTVVEETAEEAPKPVMEPLAFSPPSMAPATDSQEDPDDFDFYADAAAPVDATPDISGDTSEDNVSDKQIFEAPESDVVEPVVSPVWEEADHDEAAPESEPASDEPTSDEGLVQLVQRLGDTLTKHREWSAEQLASKKAAEEEAAAQAQAEAEAQAAIEVAERAAENAAQNDISSEAPVPQEFDSAAADDAAQAMAAFFGSNESAAAPAATQESEGDVTSEPIVSDDSAPSYRPFDQDFAQFAEADEDDDGYDFAASFTLPIGANKSTPQETPRPAFDVPSIPISEATSSGYDNDAAADAEAEAQEAAVRKAEQDYASLNPFKSASPEFVRIDEPVDESGLAEPAVLFPHQESMRTPPLTKANDPAKLRAERPRPSNDDNERALREALMNLQRMGK